MEGILERQAAQTYQALCPDLTLVSEVTCTGSSPSRVLVFLASKAGHTIPHATTYPPPPHREGSGRERALRNTVPSKQRWPDAMAWFQKISSKDQACEEGRGHCEI